MASSAEELDKIIKILKSLIVPAKGGLPLHQLEREYKINEGQAIPLAKYGFGNITALVRSIPEIRLSSDGMLTVQSANLAHLTDLVARQKTSKSKNKRMMPRLQTARSYSGRPPSYATRPSSTPVRRPIYPRSFNAPSSQRVYNNTVPPRFANDAPAKPWSMPAKLSPVKSAPPKSPIKYNADPVRRLPTVVYPGKKPESAAANSTSNDTVYPDTKPESAANRLESAACSYRNSQHEQTVSEAPMRNGYPSGKPTSAAHRLVTAALGYRNVNDRPTATELSGSNGYSGASGDGLDNGATTSKEQIEGTKGRMLRGRASNLSRVADVPDSTTEQLSARFAEMQMYKAQSAFTHSAAAAYPSTTPPPPTAPVHSPESAALANQKAFLTALNRRTRAAAQNMEQTAFSVDPKPALAAWNPTSVYKPLTSPTAPSFPISLATASAAATEPKATAFWDAGPQGGALGSPPAEPIGARVDSPPDTQFRGPAKPLKPMDRLLRQNLDNAESVRARQTLEQQVEQERRRAQGLGATAASAPTPRASYSPPIPTMPMNVICDWERQSALMMIKPLYNNVQLIGDNLMMQVARTELSLESHFVRAEGVPYRVGLCVSGLTLPQATVEVTQQRAINPTVLVCLGSIDILMDCELSDICRDMLQLLLTLSQKKMLVNRVYVCNLPPLPTATPIQINTLREFNKWLENFCSDSKFFFVCDIFREFMDRDYMVRSEMFAQMVRINMGGDCIVQLQPWSKQGCRTFLDKLRATLSREDPNCQPVIISYSS